MTTIQEVEAFFETTFGKQIILAIETHFEATGEELSLENAMTSVNTRNAELAEMIHTTANAREILLSNSRRRVYNALSTI